MSLQTVVDDVKGRVEAIGTHGQEVAKISYEVVKQANAIVMMRYDSAEIGQTMSEIVAYGTAAVIEPVS